MSQESTSPIVNQGTGGSSAWKVDGTGGTFPISGSVTVSGTVTANQGTANATPWLVTGTGGTFPVSGTVAATQSGTWTVQPGNTANSTAWLVTGTGGTFPITAASLPLPAGAATSALQTQPGVDIGDVTVNNAAGGSAVNIQDGGNSITVDGTVTATTSYTSITATGGTFASSGNNTLITPSNSLRISYLSLSAAAANTAAVLCIVKFTTGGSTLYEVQLLPGAIWAHHPAAGLHYVTGTAGQALVVNLDTAQTIYWSLEYADV